MLVCFRQKQLQPEGYPQSERKTVGTQAEIHTAPTVKSVLIFTNYKIISYGNKNERERSFNLQDGWEIWKIPNDRKTEKPHVLPLWLQGHGRQRTFLLCEAHIGRVQATMQQEIIQEQAPLTGMETGKGSYLIRFSFSFSTQRYRCFFFGVYPA